MGRCPLEGIDDTAYIELKKKNPAEAGLVFEE